MPASKDPDEARRRLLVAALRSGAFMLGGALSAESAWAQIFGRVPKPLPPGQSVYEIEGEVLVNGKPASKDTVIGPNDAVKTGKRSRLTFVVGKDAFILRDNAEVGFLGDSALVRGFRLVTGGLLSVFGSAKHEIRTGIATIGIRGTGVYVEAEPDRTYLCTCYGISDLASIDDPASTETIQSSDHDRPRYIVADGSAGNRIRKAPFKNHTDMELRLIEALVGCTPPFEFTFDRYRSPRKHY